MTDNIQDRVKQSLKASQQNANTKMFPRRLRLRRPSNENLTDTPHRHAELGPGIFAGQSAKLAVIPPLWTCALLALPIA